MRVKLGLIVVLAAALVSVVVVPTLGASSGARGPRRECGGRVEYLSGLEVVLGRRSTSAKAAQLRTQALRQGFQNANIIPGCNEFRVVIRGMEVYDVAVDLQSEARRAGYAATVECIKGKDDVGELEAVFGHRRSRPEAQTLVANAAQEGFVGLKLEPDPCGGFEVYVSGFKNRAEGEDFRDQARKNGFPVELENS